jgi:hypothetical protein
VDALRRAVSGHGIYNNRPSRHPNCFAPLLTGFMLVGRKRSQGIAQRSSRADAELGKEPMQVKSDCPVREE